jgi:hypothetical protein
MGYHLLYPKDTKLCVDQEGRDIHGVEQAQGKTVGLVSVQKEIPIVVNAVGEE